MKALMATRKADDVEITLTVTTTLREWNEIAGQLKSTEYPSWKFRDVIRKAIARIQAQVDVTDEDVSP